MQQKHGSPPSIAENRKPYAFYSLNMVYISLAEMHKWHYKAMALTLEVNVSKHGGLMMMLSTKWNVKIKNLELKRNLKK